MSKTAFLILGPQNSGTKMLTAAFIAGGCQGDAGHVQRFDTEPFTGEKIVFRRSLPHGGAWPDLIGITDRMRAAGYQVQPIYIERETAYLVAGQLRTDREEEGKLQAPYAYSERAALEDIHRAWNEYQALIEYLGVMSFVVPYASFTGNPKIRATVMELCDLGDCETMTFYNANAHPRYAGVGR